MDWDWDQEEGDARTLEVEAGVLAASTERVVFDNGIVQFEI